MLGHMQDWPLLVTRAMEHAAREHGEREIVTALVEGGLHRGTWKSIAQRSARLAHALQRLGVATGDRVATLAWNTHRHVEAWFAIAGMGAVYHTVNPRLFDQQIEYIVNHAEDSVLLFDLSFLPLVERLASRFASVRTYVVLTDQAHLPPSSLPLLAYETLIEPESDSFDWPWLDENTPCGLCYTSGTTGNPKGVLYSHRSTILHAMMMCMADSLGITSRTTVMPVVPMFHANAWGVPFSAAIAGARMVLNGPNFDPETLHRLIVEEKVTASAAVPTIWLAMMQFLEKTGKDLGGLEWVMIGGSAVPRMMIETFQLRYRVRVGHAWGMTEMSPVGTIGSLKADAETLSPQQQIDIQAKQGRAVFCVDLKITDDEGRSLPRDGRAFGHLMARGPAVVGRYFKGEGGEVLDGEGYFDTGDIATIDPDGYVQITDRSKDVIKSGGEWISSIDLENAAVAHPAVAEAAVIGVPHPRWDERPLLIVVLNAGMTVTLDEMNGFLAGRVARWWLPDDLAVVDAIPHTATGKIQKLTLREQFRDHRLPERS